MSVSVSVLAVQPVLAQVAQVTAIELNPINGGIEVTLAGAVGKSSQIMTNRSGNNLTIDIPNAQLRLPQGNTYRRVNPTEEIATVTATNTTATTIRITISGHSAPPRGQVTNTDRGLALTITPAANTATERTSPPAPDEAEISSTEEPELSESAAPEVSADATDEGTEDQIEVVVTATRTEESQADVSRSVTVIDREEIEKQTAIALFNHFGESKF
jgi:hypothetical protein